MAALRPPPERPATIAPPRLTGGGQKTQRPLAGEQKIDWAAYQESEYFKTFVTNQRSKLSHCS